MGDHTIQEVRSCPGVFCSIGNPYNKVCGRIIGYQVASPDAFRRHIFGSAINQAYVDGVSITHGTPRNHIWTYAAGVAEANMPERFSSTI